VHNAYVLYLVQSRMKRYKHLSQFVLQLMRQLLHFKEADVAETGGVGKVRALLKYIFRTVSTLQLMISSVLVCLQLK